ncbi:uncharacterized protein N7496_000351 [Penicillium cataractarum]|uniref:Uncharacterized protein n=1 Tax=Penicillium cataractarum TaxID=2100454 RepID=A0A9X0B5V3_9EURO|nr:uncharacterized protein N7496_000351 [Penicillium cataractarum]KAJ5389283.1 hypothetical protein N7496_000351 [Penicillium cataractarum]
MAFGSFVVYDPSDDIPSSEWAADNAYVFDWHTQGVTYQQFAINGSHFYSGQKGQISHEVLENHSNDTSVLVATEGSTVNVEHSTIIKTGYSSSLTQASFFGANAAVNNANGSTLYLSNVNVTTHNGAANLYTHGEKSVIYAEDIWAYSSGPVSHGFYASGNGTIHAKNVHHYSGGARCSSFSGDVPNGYIHAENVIAHTDGIGSAICFLQGVCNMTKVVGYARNAPIMFSDGAMGPVTGIWKDSDLTAGLLAGIMMLSDSKINDGSVTVLDNTKLTVLGATMPALWAGNIIADAYIKSSSINNTASGILAVANYSFVTQDFDYYAGYDDNNDLSPGQLTIHVENSDLSGSLVAYNKSSINFNLAEYSNWTGEAKVGFGKAYLAVHLDKTSTWTLTGNSAIQNFSDADTSLKNIASNGFSITYDKKSQANSGLKGKTYKLPGGGFLRPE